MLLGQYYRAPGGAVINEHMAGWNDDGQDKTEELGEKPASLPLRLPRISLEVTREIYRLHGVAVLRSLCACSCVT